VSERDYMVCLRWVSEMLDMAEITKNNQMLRKIFKKPRIVPKKVEIVSK